MKQITIFLLTILLCVYIVGCNTVSTPEPTDAPTEPESTEIPTDAPTEPIPTGAPVDVPTDPDDDPIEDPDDEIDDEPIGSLIYDFEDMPMFGYTYAPCGADGSGKKLLLNGEQTPYWMGYNAEAIEIVNNAHTGQRAIRFQMSNISTHTRIFIALTPAQVRTLEKGGSLSFWYKSSGGATIKVNGYSCRSSENNWKQLQMSETMVVISADAGYIAIELLDAQGEVFFWVDDIVVTPGSEKPPTDAPIEDNGDGLVYNFENMPMTGYTYDNATGAWDGSGIRMFLHNELTPFSMGYNAESIEMTRDAHTGERAIRFQKIDTESHSRIYITLTEKQKEVLVDGGGLSFWYKCSGGATIMVGGVVIGLGSSEWTQIQMTDAMLERTAETGLIDIEILDTMESACVWIDDIVFTPVL